MKFLNSLKIENRKLKITRLRRRLLFTIVLITFIIASVQIWGYLAPVESLASTMHWSFNEGYGTTTNDTSGNSNSGTITNAVWKQNELCRTEKCLYFDGTGDLISKADDADLDFVASDDMTIMGWFRHAEIATNPDYIVAKHESGTAGGYKVYMDSDGDIAFGIDDDGSWGPEDVVGDDLGRNLDDNRWHHFSAVKDGTTGIYLYIDGVLVDSDTSLTASGSLANAASFYVGIDADGSSNSWAGFIDEIKVHREARTASQIKGDFLNGAPENGANTSFGANDKSWISDGLIGYWNLNETSGNAADLSGNGQTLTDTNTVAFVGGKYGNAGDFESANSEYQYLADNSTISITGDLTISAWIKPESVTAATDFDIAGKWDGSNESYLLEQYGDEIRMSIDSSSNYETTSASNLATATWYHIAATYNAKSQVVKIYINGNLATSSTTGTIPSSIGDDAGRFQIGAEDSTTSAANFYDGLIEDVRAYNRLFSPVEIHKLFDWAPEPVANWKLDENAGTSTVNDSSTNSLTGTMNGTMTEADWIPAKYGSGLDLDGSDDNVSIADNANLDVTGDGSMTWMTWIKHSTTAAQNIILAKHTTTTGTDGGWKLQMESDGDLRCGIDNENTSFPSDSALSTAATYDDGNWHHIACVKDGDDDDLHLYIDGIRIASDTSITTSTLANTDSLYIGVDGDGTSTDWAGGIDDVRVYNYARTPGQIMEDFYTGGPVPDSDLLSAVAYWKFDEGGGVTGYDSSGHGINLQLGLSNCNECLIPEGKFGQAFYNPSSFALATNNALISGVFSYSVSMWFKSDSDTVPAATEYLMARGIELGAEGFGIYFDTSGFLNYSIDDDASWDPDDTLTSTTDLYDGTWHHVVVVKTNLSFLEMYIDGVLHDSQVPTANTSVDGPNNIIIGSLDITNNSNDFVGAIDEVSYYNSALDINQVKRLYFNLGANSTLGNLNTDSSGVPTQSTYRELCIPGDSSTCTKPLTEWKFEEGTGTTAYNTMEGYVAGSDQEADGTLTNMNSANVWVPGKIGTGLAFDGSNDWLDTDDIDTFDGSSTFTYTGWVKFNALSNDATVIGKRLNSNDRTTMGLGGATLGSGNDDVIIIINDAAGGAENTGYTTNGAITTGVWNHWTAVFDGSGSGNSGRLKFYLNGIQQTLTYSNTIPAVVDTNTSSFGIASDNGAASTFANATLDQIRIYNVARTPAQILWEYNGGHPFGYWKFDECTGSTINDHTGSNYTGTWTGAGGGNTSAGTCSSGTGTEAWNNGTTGKYNYSLDFDGTDDVVTVTNASEIDFDLGLLNGVTFAGWVYAGSDGENDVGEIFDKGATTYCRTDSQSGSVLDLECSLDLATTDATLNLSGALNANTWHHIVVGYTDDSDDEITVYVDGVNRGSSSNGVGSPAGSDTNDLLIGGSSSANFDGKIDDFMVFGYELTKELVRTYMNQGAVRFGPSSGHP